MTLTFTGKIDRVEQICNEDKELKIIIYTFDVKTGVIESIILEEDYFDQMNKSIGKYIEINYIHLTWKEEHTKQIMSTRFIDKGNPFQIFDENPLVIS